MIEATFGASFNALASRLTARAGAIASARIEQRALARRRDPARWRSARLLWPLFGQG